KKLLSMKAYFETGRRRPLLLCAYHVNKMIAVCESRRRHGRRKRSKSLRDNALERGLVLRELRNYRGQGSPSTRRTVPYLLAPYFCVYLPPRLHRAGRAGFNLGVLSYGA